MARFQHVLVPVDLSTRSPRVVDEAVEIARASGARLTLLHVAPPLVDSETRQDLVRRVSALLETHEQAGAFRLVADGEAAREILAFAAAYEVDLIVIGARPRGFLERALLESVADTVTREAPCSVLAVGDPPDARSAEPPRTSEVLCAVDLTDSSRATLDVAAAAAAADGATLTALHILDPWRGSDPIPTSAHAVQEAVAALERSAHEQLSCLLSRHVGDAFDIAGVVSFGLVGPEIIRAATRLDTDLLVLGAHSKRVFGRAYLGSTARYVRQTARCPVLLARPRAKAPAVSVPADGARLVSKD